MSPEPVYISYVESLFDCRDTDLQSSDSAGGESHLPWLVVQLSDEFFLRSTHDLGFFRICRDLQGRHLEPEPASLTTTTRRKKEKKGGKKYRTSS
jgi:hypothetical protein